MIRPLIYAADWSARPDRRAVWRWHPFSRPRIQARPSLRSLDAILDEAQEARGEQPVLVAMDVGLGVPRPFLEAVGAPSFPQWIKTGSDPAERVSQDQVWSLERPFFRVPSGPGGLTRIRVKTPGLLRQVDRATGGKSVFILSGIPGAVGHGSRLVWSDVHRREQEGRPVRIWPFEADLNNWPREPVLAEMYPRLFYGRVGGLAGSKGDREVRIRALKRLSFRVRDSDLAWAQDSEDAFDGLVGLAGVLWWLEEGGPAQVDPVAEGGMLGWEGAKD